MFILIVVALIAGFSGTGSFASNAIVNLSSLIIAIVVFFLIYGMVPKRLIATMRAAGTMGRIAYWIGALALIGIAVWVGDIGQFLLAKLFSSV